MTYNYIMKFAMIYLYCNENHWCHGSYLCLMHLW